jgi:exodeoxyribonuclease III
MHGPFLGVLLVMAAALLAVPAFAEIRLKVLTLNLEGGRLHVGRPLADSIAAIRAADADVIALQEAWPAPDDAHDEALAPGDEPSIALSIARALGLQVRVLEGPSARGVSAVLSRHPIAAVLPSGLGVRIDVGSRAMSVFSLHLQHAPYQPYQLLGIPYQGAPFLRTAEEAVAAAEAARGGCLDALERDLAAAGDGPVIVAGDFNEPSHRDWTRRAAALGVHPVPVGWPTTRRLESMGFIDAYRMAHPDEIAKPGFTWTVLPAAREHHDRIDFIFGRGSGLAIESAAVFGEPGSQSDIAFAPWPSDHRGVLATLRFSAPPAVSRARTAKAAHDRRARE